jgi:hypothetical protein
MFSKYHSKFNDNYFGYCRLYHRVCTTNKSLKFTKIWMQILFNVVASLVSQKPSVNNNKKTRFHTYKNYE